MTHEERFEQWFRENFPNQDPQTKAVARAAFDFGTECGFDSGVTQGMECEQ